MKKLTTLALAAAVSIAAVNSFAEEEPTAGLLGKNYLGATYTYADINGGDLDDFGHGDRYGVDWNMKLSKRMDFTLGWERDRYVNDNLNSLELERDNFYAGVTLIMRPDKNLKPYLSGKVILQEKRISSDLPGGDDDEFNVGFAASTGLEWSIGKRLFTNVGLNYKSVDSFDDLYVNIDVGLRLFKRMHLVLGFDYDVEDESQYTSLGLIFEI